MKKKSKRGVPKQHEKRSRVPHKSAPNEILMEGFQRPEGRRIEDSLRGSSSK